jgi:hypothetical protein
VEDRRRVKACQEIFPPFVEKVELPVRPLRLRGTHYIYRRA